MTRPLAYITASFASYLSVLYTEVTDMRKQDAFKVMTMKGEIF